MVCKLTMPHARSTRLILAVLLALLFGHCRGQDPATESTAMISFSAMQTMLLSRDEPRTMASAALARFAVSSTTAGGLPGPAPMVFLPEFMAARTTAGPPVTTTRRIPG